MFAQVSVDYLVPSVIVIADAEAIQVSVDTSIMSQTVVTYFNQQEVTGNRARFPKPTEVYEVLNMYGQNIVVTEGEEWRIHRKITAPTFNEVGF